MGLIDFTNSSFSQCSNTPGKALRYSIFTPLSSLLRPFAAAHPIDDLFIISLLLFPLHRALAHCIKLHDEVVDFLDLAVLFALVC